MRAYLNKIIIFSLFLTSAANYSQSYIGYTVDNYSGIQGVIYNPSSVVDSRLRSDINLLSFSAFAGSDYFGINLPSILEAAGGFDIEDDAERQPMDDNQFFLNVDVLGPSFMFNLNRQNSMAVTSRVRSFFNLNNISGSLYEGVIDNFVWEDDFDFEANNFSGTMHVWTEIGLTYGRVLMEGERNFLKGGVSLKYLQGAGTLFVGAPEVAGQYINSSSMLTTTGSLYYGNSAGFDNDDVEFSNLSSGVGADIGFTYEYRPATSEDFSRAQNKYAFKLAVSVTDIGSISYDHSTVNTYNLDNTLDLNTIPEGTDLETVLKENYEWTEQSMSSKIHLPTALHVLADYHLDRKFYVSLQGSLSLNSADKEQASRLINTITASPRLETRWFSFYLPVSIRQYDGMAMGAGMRLGPLMIGSGSAISNLLSASSSTTDIYLGLKIPLYQKNKSGNE